MFVAQNAQPFSTNQVFLAHFANTKTTLGAYISSVEKYSKLHMTTGTDFSKIVTISQNAFHPQSLNFNLQLTETNDELYSLRESITLIHKQIACILCESHTEQANVFVKHSGCNKVRKSHFMHEGHIQGHKVNDLGIILFLLLYWLFYVRINDISVTHVTWCYMSKIYMPNILWLKTFGESYSGQPV